MCGRGVAPTAPPRPACGPLRLSGARGSTCRGFTGGRVNGWDWAPPKQPPPLPCWTHTLVIAPDGRCLPGLLLQQRLQPRRIPTACRRKHVCHNPLLARRPAGWLGRPSSFYCCGSCCFGSDGVLLLEHPPSFSCSSSACSFARTPVAIHPVSVHLSGVPCVMTWEFSWCEGEGGVHRFAVVTYRRQMYFAA